RRRQRNHLAGPATSSVLVAAAVTASMLTVVANEQKPTPVVLIPGDGIGPEVAAATTAVVRAAGANVDWIEAHAGLQAVERFGEPLPQATLDLIRQHRVALKGPCTTPVGKG